MSKNPLLEKMTEGQMKKREEIVKSMKKNAGDFRKRYGDKAKEVMYATATKQAMGEEVDSADIKLDKEGRKIRAHKIQTSKDAPMKTKDEMQEQAAEKAPKYPVKDKSGAVHSPMSRAKHLARMAMQKAAEAAAKKKEVKEDVEQVDERCSLDQLHSRHKFVFNKTAAGKKREQDRNREELKQQIKDTKRLGGIAGPKTKLPEEVEVSEELKGNQHKIDMNKNNKVDAHDFKLLRGNKKFKQVKEHNEQLIESHVNAFLDEINEEIDALVPVYSDEHGLGFVVESAEPDAEGDVAWFVVDFEHGQEHVFAEDLEVMANNFEQLMSE